ncbi:MAG: polymorphic toxin type 15 domain-containing protein [Leucobacter sp.]
MDTDFAADVCVADDGLINPAAFPCKSADLDTSQITGSASKITAIGTSVLAAAQDAQTAWNGLQAPGVFETPDREAVYALMTPAVDDAHTMNDVTDRLGTAISTYAAELELIRPDLEDLESRAEKFRAEAQKGYEVTNVEAYGTAAFIGYYEAGPIGQAKLAGTSLDPSGMTTISWKEHEPAVTKNRELLQEHNRILARISAVATTCANAILAEVTTMCVAPVEAITAEMLDASTEISTWGQQVEEDRNCTESVGHGLGNFWHSTWTGAASLIGRDPITGEWSGGVALQSWLGVGDFLLSTAIVLSPTSSLFALAPGPVGDFTRDRMNVAATGWGSLIGWDHQAALAGGNGWHKWEEDGIAALTESVANVGTFFIPVAGVGSGAAKTALAGTRVGSFVVKFATNAAEFAIPAGSHLVSGVVRVIDLSANGFKGGWRALVDSVKPTTVRPSGAPGLLNPATGTTVPFPDHTPVSQALGLDRPGSSAPAPRTPETGTAPVRPDPELPSARPDPEPPTGRPGSESPGARPDERGEAAPDRAGTDPGTAPERPERTGSGDAGTDPGRRDAPDEDGAPADGRGEVGSGAPEHAPGALKPEDRVRIHDELPEELRGDPRHDPLHPHYDSLPHDANGSIGTVDPDVPSESGLTNSGRLIDPDSIPETLRPFLESEPPKLIVRDGVLYFADNVEVTFNRNNSTHDLVEFERQVDLQERAIQQLSASDWQKNIERYREDGRIDTQVGYRQEWLDARAESLVKTHHMEPEAALAAAKDELKGLVGLHGPDQFPGGQPPPDHGLRRQPRELVAGFAVGQRSRLRSPTTAPRGHPGFGHSPRIARRRPSERHAAAQRRSGRRSEDPRRRGRDPHPGHGDPVE